MGQYFFRVEAVNLYNTIFDTNDISTVRGGSFLLLKAVEQLQDLEPLSIGASAGLFKSNLVSTDEAADDLKKRIVDQLNNVAADATFVVNYIKHEDKVDTQDIIKKLITLNRFSQFRQPTVIPPDPEEKLLEQKNDKLVEISDETKAITQCEKDGFRPGTVRIYTPGSNEKVWISKWTNERREKGKKLRQKLFNNIYQSTVKVLPELKSTISEAAVKDSAFTDDLESLGKASDKGNLNGKVAVIYIDGNSFGKIRDKTCKYANILEAFDRTLQQELRGKIFLELIATAITDTDFNYYDQKKKQSQIRLETLLWGGDEVEWVVPAWKAWDVLKMFYNVKGEFRGRKESEKYPLTHACGVVFCHHNAPIREIRKLVRLLADDAKARLKTQFGGEPPKSHTKGNVIKYLVLESFDNITESLGSFAQRYYKIPDLSPLTIYANDLDKLESAYKQIIRYFPHSKVYEIIDQLKSEATSKTIDEIVTRGLSELDSDRKEAVKKAIESVLSGENQIKWFMVADLWDYIANVKGGDLT